MTMNSICVGMRAGYWALATVNRMAIGTFSDQECFYVAKFPQQSGILSKCKLKMQVSLIKFFSAKLRILCGNMHDRFVNMNQYKQILLAVLSNKQNNRVVYKQLKSIQELRNI